MECNGGYVAAKKGLITKQRERLLYSQPTTSSNSWLRRMAKSLSREASAMLLSQLAWRALTS